eukprot:CAMPEP_0172324414 /NCGR_PEP_ID=MMETSP1058-20130122/51331_1 /TAXON_ID=83371 /ORGANISM="Detonula confervacea, Strain CCMP 353" /LENGTH=594 /DNA_ID=CAMNT_0013040689 /DNA_START=8 /DNA_END=1792 /DNA_ORIENTATION=+
MIANENNLNGQGGSDGADGSDAANCSDDDNLSFSLDEDEDYVALDEERLIQLKRNDPGLTSLGVVWDSDNGWGDSFVNSVDWVVEGNCIGKNTHLEKFYIENFDAELHDEHAWDHFTAFCKGLASNRSIERLRVFSSNLAYDEGAFSSLCLFIEHNSNLCRLEIGECDMDSECTRLLARALSRRRNKTSLKEFILKGSDISGMGDSVELITALNGYCNLVKLSLNQKIGQGGCTQLVNMLQNPGSKLKTLGLCHNDMGGESSTIFANALAKKTALKFLDLSYSSSMSTKLRAFSLCWQNPQSTLKRLDLIRSGIDDEGATALGNSLANQSTLRTLNIGWNKSITSLGWREFASCLRNPNSSLEKLSIAGNNIDDEGAAAVANALANNTVLKALNASDNGSAGAEWRSLSACLQNPTSALENLDLRQNNIDERAVIDFADALAHNTSLNTLLIDDNPGLTTRSWAALSNTLCNKSSIERTYLSNHALRTVIPILSAIDLSSDLVALLHLNENSNKTEVARQKIMKHHFPHDGTNHTDIQVFIDMEMIVLPCAIAWIGRDDVGRSLLYHLLQSAPSLFDFDSKAKARGSKRKLETV